jgi:hypothetical protein
MPARRRISAALRRRLAEAAGDACSYCRSPSLAGVPLAVDHIIPLAAGGADQRTNLCLACYRCNEFKGAQTAAIDALTSAMTPLFHPNQQSWDNHFAWSQNGLTIIPLSAVGRVTVDTLRMNDTWLQQARRIWMLAGIHPPLS